MSKFASLKLRPELLDNLSTLGYTSMTPIQSQSLPPMLAGKDVIAQGQTGSGKTAAFGLALLDKLNVKAFRVQTLVLCPTRELADQVSTEIRRLARSIHNIKVLTLCGGTPMGPQIGSLEHGAHIVVGTPGRIEEHLRKGRLSLADVTTLVLDEADRMLDMGFQPAIDAITAKVPASRQTLLFSATYPREIQAMAKRVTRVPVIVQVEAPVDDTSIEQHFYQVTGSKHRRTALRQVLGHFKPPSALVFCNTRKETQAVADMLAEHGFSALALHGDFEQKERDRTLALFSNKSVCVLVATDVAARGLHVDALDLVVNYEPAHDAQTHLHRIGRTGRAGSTGTACTLYDDAERHKVALIEARVDPILDAEPLPQPTDTANLQPEMITLHIDGGRKQKLRPGDVLGALTSAGGITADQVGKINLFDNWLYVAVARETAQRALQKLSSGKLKGRTFRVRQL